jgi:hypothetical protein
MDTLFDRQTYWIVTENWLIKGVKGLVQIYYETLILVLHTLLILLVSFSFKKSKNIIKNKFNRFKNKIVNISMWLLWSYLSLLFKLWKKYCQKI